MPAKLNIKEISELTPKLLRIPFNRMWYDYDKEADVLYINFKERTNSDDADLSDDDIVIHYEKGKIVGLTILNASKQGEREANGKKFPGKPSQKSRRLKAR